ncbi:MAG: bifunctional riboflavin kinase/FAD synthetase [Planctomycetia bacterium]|nr:bifunctional riboflavin kinase/FAD synthetase [Planctomycetia bacterium]
MHIKRGFETPELYRDGWVTIGNFDGVHRGHQAMLATLVFRARETQTRAVVMTFDPHPITLLRPQQMPPALSLLDHKLELFEQHSIDTVIVYPTDHALLKLTPGEFFQNIVLDQLNAVGMVEGPNFFFGQGRAGNVETLRSLCERAARKFEVVPALIMQGRMVSSSEVRAFIAAGEIVQAVEMLGHPYRIRGVVGRGAARGRTIGFPTANLDGISTLLPPDGVYAGRCRVGGKAYLVAINLGPNPTFGESVRKFETHILDFAGDLYGRTLDVDLIARVRSTVRFESREALMQQLKADLIAVRTLANELSRE